MFWHNFKYNLLVTMRDRTEIFWSLIFVIILGTLFYITFGNAYSKSELLKKIPVAVYISDEAVEKNFKMFIADISLDEETGEKLLDITYVDSMEQAEKLLSDDDVTGVYYSEDGELKLLVGDEGITEEILALVVGNYHEIMTVTTFLSKKNQDKLPEALATLIMGESNNSDIVLTDASMDVNVTYFYNLLAMGCLFASFSVVSYVARNQANLSAVGARTVVTGANGFIHTLSGLLANWLLLFLNEIIAMLYLILLGVDLGSKYPALFLILLVGTLTGVSLGYFIGSLGKVSKAAKDGIAVGVSLVLCFLSGLMINYMKYIIEMNIPILNRINPAALIADSFHALNIYDNYTRFTQNMLTLVIMSVIFIVCGTLIGRRKQYASI